MTIRRMHFLLWGLSAAFLLAAAAFVAWTVIRPLPARHRAGRSDWSDAPASASRPHVAAPSINDFDAHLGKPLQRPLYETAAATGQKAATEPTADLPTVNLRLVGTMIEPEKSLAMLMTPSGEIEIRGVGQGLGPPYSETKIAEITSGQIVLTRAGSRLVVTLEAPRENLFPKRSLETPK